MPSQLKSPPAKIVAGVIPQAQELLYKCSESCTYLKGELSFAWQNLDQEPYWKKQLSKDPTVPGKDLSVCWQTVGLVEGKCSPHRDNVFIPAL